MRGVVCFEIARSESTIRNFAGGRTSVVALDKSASRFALDSFLPCRAVQVGPVLTVEASSVHLARASFLCGCYPLTLAPIAPIGWEHSCGQARRYDGRTGNLIDFPCFPFSFPSLKIGKECEIGWRAPRRGGRIKYDQLGLGTLRYYSRNPSANQPCVRGVAETQDASPLGRICRQLV